MPSRGFRSYAADIYSRIAGFIASNWFFSSVVIIFSLEALWLALVNRYGMAFDEGYHFGLIQFFSHHLNPIIKTQPSGTYNLGAIAHNSSFLYHYLLSFPYRLLAHFTSSLKTIVIILRLFNIGLAITNLLIIKRLLRELKLPKVPANLIILTFAFTPMLAVLAAQINYDNLLLPLTSLTLLFTLIFVKQLRKNQLNIQLLLIILSVCLFASLVKFEFLAVFIGVVLVIGIELYSYWRRSKKSAATEIKKSFVQISKPAKASLAASLLLGLGLFTIFYGVNIVKYHNPVPSCDQVLNIKNCSEYYAWDRNHTLAVNKPADAPHMNLGHYMYLWVRVMHYQIFAEIVPTGGLVYIQPMFKIVVFLLSGLSVLCALLSWRKLVRNKLLLLLVFISMVYLLVLLGRNYHDYLQLGQPVAIQGRYLLPVLPIIYALLGMGIYFVTQSRRLVREMDKILVVLLIIFSFLYWGGYARYAQTISPNFHWPQSSLKIDT